MGRLGRRRRREGRRIAVGRFLGMISIIGRTSRGARDCGFGGFGACIGAGERGLIRSTSYSYVSTIGRLYYLYTTSFKNHLGYGFMIPHDAQERI